jgi:hypothetical protein
MDESKPQKKATKTTTMTRHCRHDSVDRSAASSSPSTSNMSTKTYLLLYHKKIAKETAFSHNNQPEKHHHGIFSHVSAKNGVSWQLNINKSHDIQFPWAVMPSEPMMIVDLSESLPPAKISMLAATAHGGVFFLFFGDFLCPFYRDFT